MRFQFSLATLLVCTTVLGVVFGLSVVIPQSYPLLSEIYGSGGGIDALGIASNHPPTGNEIARRMAIYGPLLSPPRLACFGPSAA